MDKNLFPLIIQFAIIIGIFWFFLIRPQRERQKKTDLMRKNVTEGDEVVTIGGIYGKVINAKDEILTLEVGSDKTRFKLARWAVGNVLNKDDKAPAAETIETSGK